MSRFLSGLIARAEGRAPVLQRRQRALFEPLNGGTSAGGPLEQNVMRVAAPISASTPRDQVQHADPTPTRSRDDHAVAAARTPPDAPRPALLPEAPAAWRVPVPAPMHDEPRPHAAPREPQPEVPSTITRHTLLRDVAQVPASSSQPASHDTPAPPRHADASPPSQLSASAIQRATTPPAAVLLAKAHTTTLVRHERHAAATPAPVQISIGRVEVRAVGASGERGARASGPSAPRLSLDDYLRQRNGASR